MELIDNINHRLGDDLKSAIKPGAKLRIAASCFSIYAFEALKTGLEQMARARTRGLRDCLSAEVAKFRWAWKPARVSLSLAGQ